MKPKYYVGVDGGGTKCRVRLTNHLNDVLAECEGGSANIYSDFDSAVNEVNRLIAEAFTKAELPLSSTWLRGVSVPPSVCWLAGGL